MDKFTTENYNTWLTLNYTDLKDRGELESIKDDEKLAKIMKEFEEFVDEKSN